MQSSDDCPQRIGTEARPLKTVFTVIFFFFSYFSFPKAFGNHFYLFMKIN